MARLTVSEPLSMEGSSATRGGVRAVAPSTVVVANESDAAAWDEYVAATPGANGYHEWRWRSVFARAFGHQSWYLMARRGGDLAGVLPLVEIRSRLFGSSLTSLPFLNYGGVLASDPGSAGELTAAAAALARERGLKHVELRHTAPQFPSMPHKQHKVTMHLALAGLAWDRLDRKVRNQIRKAQKSNLTSERGGLGLLPEFYSVFARNMRDLGTPVYSRRWFEEILGAFPDRTRLTVVRLDAQPVAAGLTFRTKDTTEIPWASSVRDYSALCPNHLLYWELLQAAQAEGCAVFDFGRSTPGEGTFKFKEQWGASPVPLHWEYPFLGGGAIPDSTPKNPKFQIAIALWKKLPLPLANGIGPHIVRAIP